MATPSLAMIPSGYKASKLYSVLPSDGTGDFTVARAGLRHRINSDLKLELIDANVPALNYDAIGGCPVLNTEPQTTNLITYPITFSDDYWTKGGAILEADQSTLGTVAFSDDASSDNTGDWTKEGTATLVFNTDHYEYSNNAGGGYGIYLNFTVTNGQLYQYQFDIKDGTATSIDLLALFRDASTGSNYISKTVTSSNGWTTYKFIGKRTTDTDARINFYTATNLSTTTLFIKNISVTEIKGYSSPSVNFQDDAFKLVESAADVSHHIETSLTGLTSAIYTGSVFVKASERYKVAVWEAGNSGDYATWDLSTGLKISEGGSPTYSITAMANGWYKISLTPDAASTRYDIHITILSDSYTTGYPLTTTYTGDGTSGVYIFMAQVKAGLSATSPTFTDITLADEGTTTTRLADAVSGGGDVNSFDSTSGVLEVEMSALVKDATTKRMSISDGTTSNAVYLGYVASTEQITFVVVKGGVNTYLYTATVTDVSANAILKLKWSASDFGVKIDGVEVDSQASGTTFSANTLTSMQLNGGSGSNLMYADVKNIKVYKGITSY
jgi:hypothetical protein